MTKRRGQRVKATHKLVLEQINKQTRRRRLTLPPPTPLSSGTPGTSGSTKNNNTTQDKSDYNRDEFIDEENEHENDEYEWEYVDNDDDEIEEEFHHQENNDATASGGGDGETVPNKNNTEHASSGEVFQRMLQLVVRLFPQSKPTVSKLPPPQCLHENNYSQVERKEKLSHLRLYDRVSMIRSDVAGKVSQLMGKGKKPSSLLPLKRRYFQVAEEDSLHRPEINVELQRMTGKRIPVKETMQFPSEDISRIETRLITLQENQSFTLWLISSLFNLMHEEGYTSSDPEVLAKISDSLSLSMVNQSTLTHELSSYIVAQRREQIFNHLPYTISDVQKQKLASATPFSNEIFDPDTLKEVISEYVNDVATSAQVAFMSSLTSTRFTARRRRNRVAAVSRHTAGSQRQYILDQNQSPNFVTPPANETPMGENISTFRGQRFPNRRSRRVARRFIRNPKKRQDFQQ